jgi:hypothetical protein
MDGRRDSLRSIRTSLGAPNFLKASPTIPALSSSMTVRKHWAAFWYQRSTLQARQQRSSLAVGSRSFRSVISALHQMLLHDADLPDDRIYSIDKRSGSRKSAITRLTPNGYQVVKAHCSNVARYGGRVDGRVPKNSRDLRSVIGCSRRPWYVIQVSIADCRIKKDSALFSAALPITVTCSSQPYLPSRPRGRINS